MKQKDILLWVIAIVALVMSLIAVIGPKGLKSDAAMRPSLQVSGVQNAGTITLNGSQECDSLAAALVEAKKNADYYYSDPAGSNIFLFLEWNRIVDSLESEIKNANCGKDSGSGSDTQ
jgi:hypothetical protein